jgi:hypothetical protein
VGLKEEATKMTRVMVHGGMNVEVNQIMAGVLNKAMAKRRRGGMSYFRKGHKICPKKL